MGYSKGSRLALGYFTDATLRKAFNQWLGWASERQQYGAHLHLALQVRLPSSSKRAHCTLAPHKLCDTHHPRATYQALHSSAPKFYSWEYPIGVGVSSFCPLGIVGLGSPASFLQLQACNHGPRQCALSCKRSHCIVCGITCALSPLNICLPLMLLSRDQP